MIRNKHFYDKYAPIDCTVATITDSPDNDEESDESQAKAGSGNEKAERIIALLGGREKQDTYLLARVKDSGITVPGTIDGWKQPDLFIFLNKEDLVGGIRRKNIYIQ